MPPTKPGASGMIGECIEREKEDKNKQVRAEYLVTCASGMGVDPYIGGASISSSTTDVT